MHDRYTLKRLPDGRVHILEDGKPHTQSAFKPTEPFDELVLQALLDFLNGHRFEVPKETREVVERAGKSVEVLRLGCLGHTYPLYMRMLQDGTPDV